MTLALHHRKVSWSYGQGTELRLVNYVPGGSVYLQSIGEDDNGVIELPAQLLAAVGRELLLLAGASPELLDLLQTVIKVDAVLAEGTTA